MCNSTTSCDLAGCDKVVPSDEAVWSDDHLHVFCSSAHEARYGRQHRQMPSPATDPEGFRHVDPRSLFGRFFTHSNT